MKLQSPQEMRARTISNIIVVWAGILLLAIIFYFGKIWGFISALVDVALPFIVGFAIAFLLIPIVNKVEWFFNQTLFRKKRHPKLNRVLASIVAFAVLLTLLAGFFVIMVPQLINSIKSILQYIANFIAMNTDTINELLVKFKFLSIEGEQLVIAWENVVSQLMSYTTILVDNIMLISNGIYTVIFQLFVGMIAAFYLLLDKEVFCAQIKKLCYATFKQNTCETLISWTRRANRIFAGFITGKIIDSLIIGILCYFLMLLFGFEYALLISVVVGITNIIPFFGPFIGAIPSILILLLVNPYSALGFAILILVLQQLDGNVIGPFILGDYVGVSPFWIMVSIVIGGGLFGFAGMLLSVPMFALGYAIVRTVIELRLKQHNLPTESEFYAGSPENLREEERHEASNI